MKTIRTIAKINTFVVYPIVMIVAFRDEIKEWIDAFRQGAKEEFAEKNVTNLKAYYVKAFKEGWNEGFNS